jgi:hypothetical protein
LIGSTVGFVGDSDESRKGILSDLQTHRVNDFQPHNKDIKIEVDIIPFRDVHPGCVQVGLLKCEALLKALTLKNESSASHRSQKIGKF